MATTSPSRPPSAILLTILMAFQAVSALGGGAALVLTPSGDLIQLPLSVLDTTPFSTFLWPGLILFLVLGVFPAIVTYALWASPTWRSMAPVEHRIGEHWAWAAAVVASLALIIWCTVEFLMIGYTFLILLYGMLGATMLVLTLLPGTRQYYACQQEQQE